MANLTAVDSFDNVYQLEITDDVVGGSSGVSNSQAKALLNRTEFLKNRIGHYKGIKLRAFTTNSSLTLVAADSGKLVVCKIGTSMTYFLNVILPDASLVPVGAKFTVFCYNEASSNPTVNCDGEILQNGDIIEFVSDGADYYHLVVNKEQTGIGSIVAFPIAVTPPSLYYLPCNGDNAPLDEPEYGKLSAVLADYTITGYYDVGSGSTWYVIDAPVGTKVVIKSVSQPWYPTWGIVVGNTYTVVNDLSAGNILNGLFIDGDESGAGVLATVYRMPIITNTGMLAYYVKAN